MNLEEVENLAETSLNIHWVAVVIMMAVVAVVAAVDKGERRGASTSTRGTKNRGREMMCQGPDQDRGHLPDQMHRVRLPTEDGNITARSERERRNAHNQQHS